MSEIEQLLNPESDVIPIKAAPPSSPPSSGSLFLYDRSVTRNYKGDGHEWIKKRNSHKVREDHVKLRVGGKFRVSGCYVHSSNFSTFHRRAYHLLNPETGTALYPVINTGNIVKNKPPSLVLVHYLDTKMAQEYAKNLLLQGIDISPTFSQRKDNFISNGKRREKPVNKDPESTISHHGKFHFSQKINHTGDFSSLANDHNNLSSEHSKSDYLREHNGISETPGFLEEIECADEILDGNTLDFLWDVVMEENKEKGFDCDASNYTPGYCSIYNHGKKSGKHQTESKEHQSFHNHVNRATSENDPNHINFFPRRGIYPQKVSDDFTKLKTNSITYAQNMKDYTEPIELLSKNFSVKTQNEADISTTPKIKDYGGRNQDINLLQHVKVEKSHDPGISTFLSQEDSKSQSLNLSKESASIECIPDIIDITPDTVEFQNDVQIVLSLNAPISHLSEKGSTAENRRNIYVVCLAHSSNRIKHCVFEAKILNPFCLQCVTHSNALNPGPYKVVIVASYSNSQSNFIRYESTGSLIDFLGKLFLDKNSSLDSYHSLLSTAHSNNLKVLTRLSGCLLYCRGAVTKSDNSLASESSNNSSVARQLSDLPAPPAAMALVATVLRDFPNPPPEAVLPPDTTISRLQNSSEPKRTFQKVKATSTSKEAKAMFMSAMEATVEAGMSNINGRKRGLSFLKIPSSVHDGGLDSLEAHNAADAADIWAKQTSNDPESDTKAEAVDRHCKIRFVEKLTSVISETGGDLLVQETLPDDLTTIGDTPHGALGEYS